MLAASGRIDRLVLNYARGFKERTLDFLEEWPIRELDLLDRAQDDLAPLARLGATLERLSVQADAEARCDLSELPRLRSLAAWWGTIEQSFHAPAELEEVILMDYDETTLEPLATQPGLRRIQLKMAPLLETLAGVESATRLAHLRIAGARRLEALEAVSAVSHGLNRLEFESCIAIKRLDELDSLDRLTWLGVNDCARVDSIHPIASMLAVERFHAWGTTRVMDNDLTPLLHLPRLREVRMADRRTYKPRVSEIRQALESRTR